MPFDKNVFINCPFDTQYQLLLKPLLFTIRRIGLTPRIALERFDSGEARITKITALLSESKYSIHDLSRLKSTAKNEYARLNMPLELGIDLGCRLYHPHKKYRAKRFLVLESEAFSVQKALSDFSFSDCKCHMDDAETIVRIVRNWFVETGMKDVIPASKIWKEYNAFYSKLYESKRAKGYSKKDITLLPIKEFLLFVDEVVR